MESSQPCRDLRTVVNVETSKLVSNIPVFDNTLKKDDFPTFGSPDPLSVAIDC